MSDEEYEYEYGSDEGGYQYGSDAEEETGDGQEDDLIAIENAFYEGDDCRADDPHKALEMFAKVVTLETERGQEVKWRFKALEHLVMLQHRLMQHEEMLQRYREMLQYVGDVTRNECTESINAILDALPSSKTDVQVIRQMYELTLGALKKAANERMWFNTNVKLAKTYMEMQDFQAVKRVIQELHELCKLPDGRDDPTKGNYLLEVYGLTIQVCTMTKDNKTMKEVYPKIMNLNAAVEDPRLMGVIREEGGKMYMSLGQWDLAYNEFYEGFRNYQEAGNTRAKECLKYVVLANMLALSDINPFAAREAKVYQEEKEVVAMMNLRLAYEGNDLARFERTLKNKTNRIMEDEFIMSFMDPLRLRMREQVLMALVRPYRKVTLTFMAQELNLTVEDVERLLVNMILDERMEAQVDQINGYLLLGGEQASQASKKYKAMENWADRLQSLGASLNNRV